MSSDILSHRLENLIRTIVVMVVVVLGSTVSALEPVSLPAAGPVVAFVAIKGSDEVPVTVPELEALGLYRVTTETPWEQGSLTFEGVLFSEVAKYLGFEDASALRVRALDDYIQDVPREDWVDKPLILATRQDGVPLARRTQGPARLIYPLSEYAGYDSTVHDARWIWLIKSIEPVR